MKDKSKEKISFREFMSVCIWGVKLQFKMAPFSTIAYFLTNTLLELEGLIYAYVFALIIDKLITLVQEGNSDITSIYNILAILFAYGLINSLISIYESFLENLIYNSIDIQLRKEVYSKINQLGIQTMEDPEVSNLYQRANDSIWGLVRFNERVMYVVSSFVRVIVSGITILYIVPFLVPLIILAAIPKIFIDRYFLRKDWKFYRDHTEESRIANWNASFLYDTKSIQEISIIGAFDYLKGKFENFMNFRLKFISNNYKKWYSLWYLSNVVNQIVILTALAMIFKKTINGILTIGASTFYIRSINMFSGSIAAFNSRFTGLYESTIRMRESKEFFLMKPKVKVGDKKMKNLDKAPEITFEDVTFTYPNSDKTVLKNFDLKIKSGEKIAIVGHNGAGKTTIVKLLCGFYFAQKGKLKVNDQDLKDIKPESWYKNISILFQDYNTYPQLSVKDNIQIGEWEREPTLKEISDAADAADASGFIGEYEHKYDQLLSEKFKGGIRPSGGQWQKIALARFFYRKSSLVIFDEPTAAIDPVSESKIFSKIYNFFKDKTVIIVSHRFSTVRNADRIIVVDKGEIVEDGSHEELMKNKGKYYEAFTLQAKGYN